MLSKKEYLDFLKTKLDNEHLILDKKSFEDIYKIISEDKTKTYSDIEFYDCYMEYVMDDCNHEDYKDAYEQSWPINPYDDEIKETKYFVCKRCGCNGYAEHYKEGDDIKWEC